ncbi:MAG: DUF1259 domain-containing protein [Burkholderiales bacterium]
MRKALPLAALSLALTLSTPSFAGDIDWTKVDGALGKTPAVQGDVHRYGIPRSDLKVVLDGVTIKPALALGGWVAFEPAKDGAMLMGDLVLTEDEVSPVMLKLMQSGIEITALHNHLIRATPATLYMHVRGQGDPVKLATAVREALAESRTPFEPSASTPAPAAPLDLDTTKLDQIVGAKGKANGGVYQFSIPRHDAITENGMVVPGAMGTGTAINFQPTGNGKAAIAGDFVVTAEELNPMITALRQNGIEVVAIHSHMLQEQPRLFFVHYWANDDAIKLANGLAAALSKMAVAHT